MDGWRNGLRERQEGGIRKERGKEGRGREREEEGEEEGERGQEGRGC